MWATAEDLALARILEEGTAVRMTGQDSERGTYSQRHAVFHDIKTGASFTPAGRAAAGHRRLRNPPHSPLSEGAALGFVVRLQRAGAVPPGVVGSAVWRLRQRRADDHRRVRRFGTRQVGQTPSLVLLLRRTATRARGPDHSSARLERFLSMAADTNLRIANATTAAQYFHLLLRQALLLGSDPLPLIVLTPKSLLRNPLVASSLNYLAKGHWQPVIDDADADPKSVRRVILCSGKIYIDLVSSKFRAAAKDVALVRVEQLYPVPADDLRPVIKRYAQAEEVVWTQEEPENMGAWEFARPCWPTCWRALRALSCRPRVPARRKGRWQHTTLTRPR